MSIPSALSSFVSLSEIMGWFFGVGVVGQCVVVCCDCAIDVEVGGAEMASAVADAGVLLLWDLGCGVDDGGHALVTDVSF